MRLFGTEAYTTINANMNIQKCNFAELLFVAQTDRSLLTSEERQRLKDHLRQWPRCPACAQELRRNKSLLGIISSGAIIDKWLLRPVKCAISSCFSPSLQTAVLGAPETEGENDVRELKPPEPHIWPEALPWLEGLLIQRSISSASKDKALLEAIAIRRERPSSNLAGTVSIRLLAPGIPEIKPVELTSVRLRCRFVPDLPHDIDWNLLQIEIEVNRNAR